MEKQFDLFINLKPKINDNLTNLNSANKHKLLKMIDTVLLYDTKNDEQKNKKVYFNNFNHVIE